MADTWLDIINDALYELNVYSVGEPIPDRDVQFSARRLSKILDQWAARKVFAYNVNFSAFALIPRRQPHLIGPAGDFVVSQRPVRIEAAALILNTSTPNVDLPLNIRDDDWWANQRVKALSTTVPTDLYYSPDFPAGSLYLWPVPAVAYGIRLEMWVQLAGIPLDSGGNFDLTQAFVAPPGYNEAVTLTLEEKIARAFGKPLSADLIQQASRARSAIQSNNIKSPRIGSADYGTGAGRRSGFNFYTGGPA